MNYQFFLSWFVGFMSGFSIMITGATLNFWLSYVGIDIKIIGIFSLVSLPFAINFLFSPVIDSYFFPKFIQNKIHINKIINNINNKIDNVIVKNRYLWVMFMQLCLILFILLISYISPGDNLLYFAIVAFFISFFASMQDAALGALRVEIFNKQQQKKISGTYVFGYRIGMLVSTSGAMYISTYLEWKDIYQIFAAIIAFFPIILLFILTKYLSENLILDSDNIEDNISDSMQSSQFTQSKIIKDFNNVNNSNVNLTFIEKIVHFINKILSPIGSFWMILLIILFLLFYRIGDNFISSMINPFLIHVGYNPIEIATTGKLVGVVSAIIGGLIASVIMQRQKIIHSLIVFGVLHNIAHLFFIFQNYFGKNIYILFSVVTFESITGGMAMTAYIAFISSLCQGQYKATQYAFFTSMMGFSRSIFPVVSGYVVHIYGWNIFFLFTSLISIPSFILLWFLSKYGNDKYKNHLNNLSK